MCCEATPGSTDPNRPLIRKPLQILDYPVLCTAPHLDRITNRCSSSASTPEKEDNLVTFFFCVQLPSRFNASHFYNPLSLQIRSDRHI